MLKVTSQNKLKSFWTDKNRTYYFYEMSCVLKLDGHLGKTEIYLQPN